MGRRVTIRSCVDGGFLTASETREYLRLVPGSENQSRAYLRLVPARLVRPKNLNPKHVWEEVQLYNENKFRFRSCRFDTQYLATYLFNQFVRLSNTDLFISSLYNKNWIVKPAIRDESGNPRYFFMYADGTDKLLTAEPDGKLSLTVISDQAAAGPEHHWEILPTSRPVHCRRPAPPPRSDNIIVTINNFGSGAQDQGSSSNSSSSSALYNTGGNTNESGEQYNGGISIQNDFGNNNFYFGSRSG